MKKALVLGVCALTLAACGQVQPGHVGIKVNQFGSNAGVSNDVLGVGTHFTPPGTSIYEYPVFTRTYTYTKSADEQNLVLLLVGSHVSADNEIENEEFQAVVVERALKLSGDQAPKAEAPGTRSFRHSRDSPWKR